ncbi:MAG: Holliday junction branch migration protein RuvA [Methanolinea sp.]|nr:Holliday junction branch migration protein RuvA [Methanolinea sp.]
MIARLRGRIVGSGEGSVIIETGGIGFQVFMPRPLAEEVARSQGEVTLHTHMVVREDGVALYGFLAPGELEMFRMLISVTRVGPALACSILSQMTVSELAAAVIGGDEAALTRLSGVGKKNAGRLILELRDTMKKRADLLTGSGRTIPDDPVRRDAESALLALGFSARESRDAVSRAIAGMSTADVPAVVRVSLRLLRER